MATSPTESEMEAEEQMLSEENIAAILEEVSFQAETSSKLEIKFNEFQTTLTNSFESLTEILVAASQQAVAATQQSLAVSQQMTDALNRMVEQQAFIALTSYIINPYKY